MTITKEGNPGLGCDYINEGVPLTFTSNIFAEGVTNEVSMDTIKQWLASPQKYKKELEKYAIYQYISNGDIFQLFDLMRILPKLNYSIKTLKLNNKNDVYTLSCRRVMKEVNHKELTRDILSQTISAGTLCGVWIGKPKKFDKEYPYPILFNDLEYFFPARRKRGKWTIWCDLEYFKDIDFNSYKQGLLEELNPYITEELLNEYNKDPEHRYVEFPIERSICIRTHVLRRNQRFGIPWNTPAIKDIKHQEKLKNLEKVAANKVMNAVTVLTIGNDKNPSEYGWKAIGKTARKNIADGVQQGLNNNKEGDMSAVVLPEFCDLEQKAPQTNVLNPDKFESINSDIGNDIGIARTLTNGQGGNYASANLNLEIIYNRISELLETVETEVYNKLFKIILPNTIGQDYYLEYEKGYPLSTSEKAKMFKELHMLGYSLKPLIELLGEDFDDYIENSVYEIDNMGLRDKIRPPMSTYTMTGEDGNPGLDEQSNNDSTITVEENGGNEQPKPSV
ncbi:hypothetical protein [Clostridium sardiniense]|uniref:hypothetical protein n=1 Tax=Clostridium sardiniense TaxID=29369 RepID=UPI00195C717A|nr:hypothetical protein [Clostridium sardiniense]MBM7835744.1 hypothetical protein [Clostridium sardiniense]